MTCSRLHSRLVAKLGPEPGVFGPMWWCLLTALQQDSEVCGKRSVSYMRLPGSYGGNIVLSKVNEVQPVSH